MKKYIILTLEEEWLTLTYDLKGYSPMCRKRHGGVKGMTIRDYRVMLEEAAQHGSFSSIWESNL